MLGQNGDGVASGTKAPTQIVGIVPPPVGPTAHRPLTEPLSVDPYHIAGIGSDQELRPLRSVSQFEGLAGAEGVVPGIGIAFDPDPAGLPVEESGFSIFDFQFSLSRQSNETWNLGSMRNGSSTSLP